MSQAIPETKAAEKLLGVPDGSDLYYIKLVGIGPQALAEKNGSAQDVVAGVQGYYFVAPTDDIEAQIISIVQSCFADRRKQKEEASGTAKDG